MLTNCELLLQPVQADLTSDMAYVTRVLANNNPTLAVALVSLAYIVKSLILITQDQHIAISLDSSHALERGDPVTKPPNAGPGKETG